MKHRGETIVLGWLAAAVVLCPATAQAERYELTAPWTAQQPRYRGPQTHVQAGIGMLALPTTNVCVVSPGTCTKGDTTLTGNLTMLYQPNSLYAFGAAITISPPSGSDTPSHSTEQIPRSHRRQYLLIDLQFRDYLYQLRSTDLWLAGSAGGVVVHDFYESDTKVPNAPIIGPTAITIRTEGLSLGLNAGASWRFYPKWSAEASIRLAWWFLPSEPSCAPTGDCASLREDVAMFWMGLGVAYHSRL